MRFVALIILVCTLTAVRAAEPSLASPAVAKPQGEERTVEAMAQEAEGIAGRLALWAEAAASK